ncbi:MAG: geranylgeranyl diphosphate reductase [Hyphomicrobium sp.]|jgi:geranylgeranyl reductase|nr:geranylgeranyl diphosphate reductase [Hyphomicrobium sp.]
MENYDAVIVGGGPAGATAATDLAANGYSVLLLDRSGRIKPCGGAIPPILIEEFDIPDELLVARIQSARIVSPMDRKADMPIDGGFVGMVDREHFDEWLRERAARAGAVRRTGTFESLKSEPSGSVLVTFKKRLDDGFEANETVRARFVIGADGASSAVARQALPREEAPPFVFAYHEIVKSPKPADGAAFEPRRCDVYYNGRFSPDFYSWVFPHGDTTSIGTGTAHKGFSLRGSVADLRKEIGMAGHETIRKEGAPIPLRPRKRWDDGRNVIVAGDAAGVVAPASGEGIYYAMLCGRIVADSVSEALRTGDTRHLATARKRFMKAHGRVFWVLGMMQRFWYSNDARRERFVTMCKDPDVQMLTWQAYMHKKLVKAKPMAHMRIFVKDMAHLLGMVPP